MNIARVDKFNNGFVVFKPNESVKTALDQILKRILLVTRTEDQSNLRLLSGSDLLDAYLAYLDVCKEQELPIPELSTLGNIPSCRRINFGPNGNTAREPVLLFHTGPDSYDYIVVCEPRENGESDPTKAEPPISACYYEYCPECKCDVPVSAKTDKRICGH